MTFVPPTREEFDLALGDLGAEWVVPAGWRQWAVDVPTVFAEVVVRVSTTIDTRGGASRDKDANAIDVVAALPERRGAFALSREGTTMARPKVLRVPGWPNRVRQHVVDLVRDVAARALACATCDGVAWLDRGVPSCSKGCKPIRPGCRLCSSPMVLRQGSKGGFWGCTAYPGCRGTQPWIAAPQVLRRPFPTGVFGKPKPVMTKDDATAAMNAAHLSLLTGDPSYMDEHTVPDEEDDAEDTSEEPESDAEEFLHDHIVHVHVGDSPKATPPAAPQPRAVPRLDVARNLLLRFMDRVPREDKLAIVAAKLLDVSDRDPARAVGLILGEATPNGKPTFEALLRRRVAEQKAAQAPAEPEAPKPKGKRIAWEDASPDSGVTELAESTRPTEPLTRILQGPEGGSSTPSSEYRYHRLAHANLNAVQSLALPWVDRDVNLVVAASTSAGKTLLSEMFMGEALERGGTAMFLSPLRAVSSEKYEEWTSEDHPWHEKQVEIVTGDYVLTAARRKALRSADVIVLTSEMLDSKSRRIQVEGNQWLLRARCLIVDEAHLLTMDGRGDALEAGLMRFSAQNPRCRIVLLSATMPNVDDLGKWTTKLNGRPSVVIRSEWRPTKLTLHWPTYRDVGEYHTREEAKRSKAIDVVERHPEDRFLIFVHAKKAGHALLSELGEAGITSEFHSADLGRDARHALEKRFRTGDLRVIVATSTLAWGVNLPARRVIVLGVHRGMDAVDPIDVKQMVGRAGRMGIDPEGDAYVLVPESCAARTIAEYSQVGPIKSRLNDADTLAFHLTAEVAEQWVRTDVEAASWHVRSLASLQGATKRPDELREVLEKLGRVGIMKQDRGIDCCDAPGCSLPVKETISGPVCPAGHGGAPTKVMPAYSATMLGKVSSWLYFSPFDIADWAGHLRWLVEKDRTRDDDCLAWAIGHIKTSFDEDYIPRDVDREVGKLSAALAQKRVEPYFRMSTLQVAAWASLKGIHLNGIGGAQRGLQHDAPRVAQAFELIDKYVVRALGSTWCKQVALRLRYGCGWDEADLCRLPGVGGVRAKALVRAGLRSVADVAMKPNLVTQTLGKKIAEKALRVAKALAAGREVEEED